MSAPVDDKQLIRDLVEFLEWIGWGDKYERECSQELRQKVTRWEDQQGDNK